MIVKKILLLGEIGVGKTSIVRRLVFDQFNPDYKATIGTDVYQYEVRPSPVAAPFHFVIWDTDGAFGESIFKSVHVRQADAAFIVGDLTRRGTVESALQLAIGFSDALPGRYLRIALNKADVFSDDFRHPLPDGLVNGDFESILTSAKTGTNVKEAFHQAATTIIRRS
jgi:small GTP-binding protein